MKNIEDQRELKKKLEQAKAQIRELEAKISIYLVDIRNEQNVTHIDLIPLFMELKQINKILYQVAEGIRKERKPDAIPHSQESRR